MLLIKMERKERRLLLSSVCKPFALRYGDSVTCTADISFPLVWAQEAFRINQIVNHSSLDIIAYNLKTPSTVLHYPTLNKFIKEVKKGYAYVGLTFIPATFHKVKEQIKAVRRYSPRSKIILGGYGTSLPDDILKGMSDYICREEGVSFMQTLLGEKITEVRVPMVVVDCKLFRWLRLSRMACIIVSLGCPNGCDFCSPSAYFKKEKIYFLRRGQDIFNSLHAIKKQYALIDSYYLYDEDFLQDKIRVMELLECIREANDCYELHIYSSIRSVSQYKPSELAELGISTIFIGLDGLQTTYDKMQGDDFLKMSLRLREYGIGMIPSMIIGFDYQTRKIVNKEFDYLLNSKPYMAQISIFFPCPGTEAWWKLKTEGRLNDLSKDYRHFDGSMLLYTHPFWSSDELRQCQRELFKKEYDALGPSIYRLAYVRYLGYETFKDSAHSLLKKRAQLYYVSLRALLPFYLVGIIFARNRKIRTQLKMEYKKIIEAVGPMTLSQRVRSFMILCIYLCARAYDKISYVVQPRFQKFKYN